MTTLVCPTCKDLVEVLNKTVAQHGPIGSPCAFSGARYVPSKGRRDSSEGSSGPRREVTGEVISGVSGPKFEVIAARGCEHGMMALIRVSAPDASPSTPSAGAGSTSVN